MIIPVLLVAALAWWLHKEGALLPNLRRFGVAAGAAIIALRLAETGQLLPAAAVAAGGVWWWVASKAKPAALADLGVADARAVLGLPATADREQVNAAFRRLMAQVHPDKGGSADLAARVTAARDLLLRG